MMVVVEALEAVEPTAEKVHLQVEVMQEVKEDGQDQI